MQEAENRPRRSRPMKDFWFCAAPGTLHRHKMSAHANEALRGTVSRCIDEGGGSVKIGNISRAAVSFNASQGYTVSAEDR